MHDVTQYAIRVRRRPWLVAAIMSAQRALSAVPETTWPECLDWNLDQVADWVEDIGFPQYKECFRENLIHGGRLILMEASNLPSIGVYKLEHILALAESIRQLLGIPKSDQEDVTTVPDPKVLYLRQKRLTGRLSSRLTYTQFLKDNADLFSKFQFGG